MQELWFLPSACCLMLIDIYMKFHEDSLNHFQVFVRTRFCDKSPREITQKNKCKWFLYAARHRMLNDIYMKFCEDNLNNFQVIERT